MRVLTDEEIAINVARGRGYILVLLTRGVARPGTAPAPDIQQEHLRYLMTLREAGKILINGPVRGDGDLRGISIYDSTDLEAVRALVEADPAVASGRLGYELLPWLGRPGDALR